MIIGLSASMGTGKSTAFKFAQEYFGANNVKLVKFAGPLYEIQEMFYNRISSVYTRPADFQKNRPLLQFLGADVGRAIDKDLWIKLWKVDAQKAANQGQIVISDDTRFDNEAEAIRSMGGHIVKVTSSTIADRTEVVKEGITAHESENGISPNFIDYTIDNSDTIESFKHKLQCLFDEILSSRSSK